VAFDELTCFRELTRASTGTSIEDRQRAVNEFLTRQEFLEFIKSDYCYWRGNLYVVRGTLSPDNPPIHWHWQWDRKQKLEPLAERVALPFLMFRQGDTVEALPRGDRENLERGILESAVCHSPQKRRFATSYHAINALQEAEKLGSAELQEVGRGEILFFKSVNEARLIEPDGTCPEHNRTPKEDMWSWLQEQSDRSSSPFKKLFSLFNSAADLSRKRLWEEAHTVFSETPAMRQKLRFNVDEPEIEKVGSILCFKAGDFVVRHEQASAYCLVQFACPLQPSKLYSVLCLFARIAEVGVLSVALAERIFRLLREYMHGFEKPLGLLTDDLEAVIKKTKSEESLRVLRRDERLVESVRLQALVALDRARDIQGFALNNVVGSIAEYYNGWYAPDKAAVTTSGRDLQIVQRLECLQVYLHNAIANALEHGDPAQPISIVWDRGKPPSDLIRSVSSKLRAGSLDDMTGLVNPDDVLILIHNRRRADAMAPEQEREGTQIIQKMADELGGCSRVEKTDHCFIRVLKFPVKHPGKCK